MVDPPLPYPETFVCLDEVDSSVSHRRVDAVRFQNPVNRVKSHAGGVINRRVMAKRCRMSEFM